MAFDFDIVYLKGSSIPRVDAQSKLSFVNEQKEINEDTEEILHWVETDALLVDLKEEILRDPVLSRISDRIKRNRWSYCSQAERPYKEVRHKLTVEKGVICKDNCRGPGKSH